MPRIVHFELPADDPKRAIAFYADEIMLITSGGQMVRIPVQGIRYAGRNTMGVKLVNLDADDKLQAIAPVIAEQQEEAAIESKPAK